MPDGVAEQLRSNGQDLERTVLEAIAAAGYRSGKLGKPQIRQLLGLESWFELEDFFRRAGIMHAYTPEELEQDYRNSRMASDKIHGAP